MTITVIVKNNNVERAIRTLKKKVLKEMDNNPQEFAQDMSPDVYYDD